MRSPSETGRERNAANENNRLDNSRELPKRLGI